MLKKLIRLLLVTTTCFPFFAIQTGWGQETNFELILKNNAQFNFYQKLTKELTNLTSQQDRELQERISSVVQEKGSITPASRLDLYFRNTELKNYTPQDFNSFVDLVRETPLTFFNSSGGRFWATDINNRDDRVYHNRTVIQDTVNKFRNLLDLTNVRKLLDSSLSTRQRKFYEKLYSTLNPTPSKEERENLVELVRVVVGNSTAITGRTEDGRLKKYPSLSIDKYFFTRSNPELSPLEFATFKKFVILLTNSGLRPYSILRNKPQNEIWSFDIPTSKNTNQWVNNDRNTIPNIFNFLPNQLSLEDNNTGENSSDQETDQESEVDDEQNNKIAIKGHYGQEIISDITEVLDQFKNSEDLNAFIRVASLMSPEEQEKLDPKKFTTEVLKVLDQIFLSNFYTDLTADKLNKLTGLIESGRIVFEKRTDKFWKNAEKEWQRNRQKNGLLVDGNYFFTEDQINLLDLLNNYGDQTQIQAQIQAQIVR